MRDKNGRKLNMTAFYRTALLMLTLVLVLTSAGCSGSGLSTQEKKVDIKVIVKKLDASFWSQVKLGTDAAEKEFGVNVDFEGPANENDINGQIKMVNDAIDQNADAIVLAADDYNKLVDVAERAVSKKIPVVIIDSELNSDKIVSFIGTDNVDAGEKLGETLADKLGKKCSIAVMSFVKGTATSVQREEGFSRAIGKYPDIKVLSKLYCNSDENLAQKLTEDIVKKNPGIDAIVCLNAYGTDGAARALDKLKLAGKVKIIGFDSTPEIISFMEKGVIQAIVIQNPISMGYLGVKYALDDMHGQKVPERVNTGSKVIDIDNMYLPENQKLVFPFTN